MLRPVLSVLAIATILGGAPPVHAGVKSDVPVTADPVNRFGRGALGTARNSADAVQYIYCYVGHSVSYNGFCSAHDTAGNTVSCFTTDPNKVAIIAAMTGSSYVFFSYDVNGTCTNVLVENASFFPPMVL
jgi:hypothetical protein